jgi:hypothetical protein
MYSRTLSKAVFLLLIGAIGTVLAAECLMNLTPPISRDALIHHLAIPKLWLNHGSFYEIPWAKYSYYPMNIDLLYLAALYMGTDMVPKFIHLAFGLGTGFLVFAYLNEKIGGNWGLLGMAIFVTTPVIIRLSTSAYVDLGMCFFSTTGVLSFVKWRDSHYDKMKWFVLSSCFMGLALGSKYNALIPWLFLNMMVVYCYAKDTQRQFQAVKYGLVFFAATALVACPWYVKNWILTGNPFYPLFSGLFPRFQDGTASVANIAQVGSSGFFEKRQIMYGETLFDTLLIPIRMFFQGKDNTYEYFDGVLNPVLILFLPFVFTNKEFRKDKVFLFAFSVFSIFLTFFLTRKQIRYMAFVLPFLSILATFGIKQVFSWTLPPVLRSNGAKNGRLKNSHPAFFWFASSVFFMFILALMAPNLLYLKQAFGNLNPMDLVFERETRHDFLDRHLGTFRAMEYINSHTSSEAKIFFMFVGNRGYYLDRVYRHDSSFGMKTLQGLVSSSDTIHAFRSRLKALNCTHILVRDDLFEKYLADNFPTDRIAHFLALKNQYWKPVYQSQGVTVYDLSPFV